MGGREEEDDDDEDDEEEGLEDDEEPDGSFGEHGLGIIFHPEEQVAAWNEAEDLEEMEDDDAEVSDVSAHGYLDVMMGVDEVEDAAWKL